MKPTAASLPKNLKRLFGLLLMLSLINSVYAQNNAQQLTVKPAGKNIQELPFWETMSQLSDRLNINIIFHVTAQQQLNRTKAGLKLENGSYPQTLQAYLDSNQLDFEELDERSIMVVKRAAKDSAAKSLEDFLARATEKAATEQLSATPATGRFLPGHAIYNNMPLMAMIEQLAQTGEVAVEFEPQFTTLYRSLHVEYFVVRKTTYPRALQYLFKSFDLQYSQPNSRTIRVGHGLASPSSTPLEEIMIPRARANQQ
jgi:hypothetical protein